jgi:alanine dehydrogenase
MTPSLSAACCHGLRTGSGQSGRGAVSRMNCSSAATTAAASSAEAPGATIVSFGRRFMGAERIVPGVSEVPVLDYEAVLQAVSPLAAIDRVREGLLRFHAGEWVMPPKVYLQSPPFGDFRAMPALGGGLALLKWITSFPENPGRGLPTVTGVICLSSAETGEPLMLLDARSVTALRTGAVAAVATSELARVDARTVGIIGCGLHGAWTARCLAAAGYGPGVCHDPRESVAEVLARELGWAVGSHAEALRCDVVCCVTPGTEIVVDAGSLHAGLHLNMLGADGPGKAEASIGAVASCVVFCDEWEQASHGGELTGAVTAGLLTREQVTELGAVLAGDAPGRPGPEAVTLFDSTGLAIQDLAVASAAFTAWEDRQVSAQTVHL